MSGWIGALGALRRRGADCVIVTVALAKGSTPREAGAKMVVTADETFGTVGGGELEFQAVEAAREMLSRQGREPMLRRMALGPELGQSCGGNTTLLFDPVSPDEVPEAWVDLLERASRAGRACVLVTAAQGGAGRLVVTDDEAAGSIDDAETDAFAVDMARRVLDEGEDLAGGGARRLVDAPAAEPEESGARLLLEVLRPPDLNIVLFGAGHVARSLVPVLAELPCRITWIDERAHQFPKVQWPNVAVTVSEEPENEVDAAAPESYFLVMTHSHERDLEVAERILRRGDFAYFGLIGSASKRKLFEKRLAERGVTMAMLTRMTSPIGIAGIKGKEPREIAIAVAAEILELRDARAEALAQSGARTLSA